MLQVSEVPGIIERLLGFLEIGKDFVTAETVIQIKDLMRRYPDAAEVCMGSVANISPAVGQRQCCLGRHHRGGCVVSVPFSIKLDIKSGRAGRGSYGPCMGC